MLWMTVITFIIQTTINMSKEERERLEQATSKIQALSTELGDMHHQVMLITPWECEEISQMDLCALILEVLQWYQFGLNEIIEHKEQ